MKETEIYNKGVQEGIKHSQPSPLTNKTLNKMNEKITNIEKDISLTKKDVEYLKDEHKKDSKRNTAEHNDIGDLLTKAIEEIKQDNKEFKINTKKECDDLKNNYVDNNKFNHIKAVQDKHSDYFTWIIKLVLGLIISALIGLIVVSS